MVLMETSMWTKCSQYLHTAGSHCKGLWSPFIWMGLRALYDRKSNFIIAHEPAYRILSRYRGWSLSDFQVCGERWGSRTCMGAHSPTTHSILHKFWEMCKQGCIVPPFWSIHLRRFSSSPLLTDNPFLKSRITIEEVMPSGWGGATAAYTHF